MKRSGWNVLETACLSFHNTILCPAQSILANKFVDFLLRDTLHYDSVCDVAIACKLPTLGEMGILRTLEDHRCREVVECTLNAGYKANHAPRATLLRKLCNQCGSAFFCEFTRISQNDQNLTKHMWKLSKNTNSVFSYTKAIFDALFVVIANYEKKEKHKHK